MKQPGFFDLNERHKKSNEKDPLTHLNSIIDWEDFRPILMKVRPKNNKKLGRPAFDVVLMFKILILQSLYNLADDEIEFQIQKRFGCFGNN